WKMAAGAMAEKPRLLVGRELHRFDLAENELLGADANAVAVLERLRAADEPAVHAGAVSTAEIFDGGPRAFDVHFRVVARHERIDEGDPAVRPPPDERVARRKIELLQQE